MVRVDLEYSFPVGIRFHPTDEELLNHYLKLKTLGSDSDVRAIPVVDICNWEPWELPAVFLLHFSITSPNFSGLQWNDHRWYFFCPRDGSCRVNRSTNSGYWKPTGRDRMIKSRETGDLIGSKRALVFYEGRLRNSHRTNWVINEYRLNAEMAFVLCVLTKNKDGNARGEAEEPSSDNGTDLSHITAAPPNNSPHPNHVASGAENHVVEESVTELSPEDEEFIWHCLYEQPTYTDHPEQEPTAMDFQNPNGFSKTDTDVLQSRNDPIRHVTMLQAGSSNSPRYRRENICFLGDEFGASSASSVDSIADEPFEINSIDLINPKFPLNNTTTGRPQYQPIRSPIAVAQMSASPKIYAQEVLHKEPNRGKMGESSCILAKHGGRPDSVKARATATELPEKENSNVVSKNDLGMAGGGNTKLSVKSREQKEPSGRNQKGSINFVETPIASSYQLSPHCSDVKDSKSSSETDTEGLQSRIDPILETFRLLNINSHGGISQGQSSNSRQYRRENIGVHRNESVGSSASSVDSIADKPFVASRLQLPSPNFPINNTGLHYSVAQRIASQKVCMQEVIHKEPCQGKVGGSSCIAEKHEGKPDSVKVAAEDESGDKRIKVRAEEGESKIAEQNINKNNSSSINNNRETSADTSKENSKVTEVQQPDYIHVRARRGQATDSHSLAERVRREKISERMKNLQDLVPGCNKITGKAGMLDEIINYVQSLQRQVEFLSMKLAAVNQRLDFNIDNFITGNVSVCQDSII